jgi:peptidoglycan/xylan/chitin deacetylase (PgdA/CDA1 family)
MHGIRQSAAAAGATEDPAAARYAIGVERFEQVLACANFEACCTVRDFTAKSAGDYCVWTFDDGLASDFVTVFPRLVSRRIFATFFVTVEHLGRHGYTTPAELAEMAAAGMEIGSHGLTHRYLVTMPRREALGEIRESKRRLEHMLGVKVVSFAPVGGHFAKWMIDAAAEAGYRAFATMIPGRTTNRGTPLLLHRNHIQSHHSAVYASRLVCGHPGLLLANRLRYFLLKQPKNWLGLRNYDRLKHFVLQATRRRSSRKKNTES